MVAVRIVGVGVSRIGISCRSRRRGGISSSWSGGGSGRRSSSRGLGLVIRVLRFVCVSMLLLYFYGPTWADNLLSSWPIQAPAAIPPIPAAASMAVECPLSFFSFSALCGSAGAPGAVL